MPPQRSGADALCAALVSLGVEHVFGLPGTQNIQLFEALRRSPIRSVLATDERAAGFMANGYARASGRVGVLVTIPGPGFTFALPALAEARHDSVGLVHVVGKPADAPGAAYHLQAIDQPVMARPVVKGVIPIDRGDEVAVRTRDAYALAQGGEPGPVVLHYAADAIAASCTADGTGVADNREQPHDHDATGRALSMLLRARRPVMMVGQGAADSSAAIIELIESLGMPLFSTASGRGIVAEDHPLALAFDYHRGNVAELNGLLRESDCVLVVGCKLSHNGSGGFALELPASNTIHVDASAAVLGANYPVAVAVHARAATFLTRVLDAVRRERGSVPSAGFSPEEVAQWRMRLCRAVPVPEPSVHGFRPPTPQAFVSALRRALPRETILVSDSGLHQSLVRRHFTVLSPRGFILPSDFQSMGYGIPAAIGAKLAAPDRPVVAVVGDGGFAMSGWELLTAVREDVPLVVIVLNDGRLNLIRLQQLGEWGRTSAVDLLNPDFGRVAEAVGARYLGIEGEASLEALGAAVRGDDVTLAEVWFGDNAAVLKHRAAGLARASVRDALGPRAVGWVKKKLRGR